MAEIAARGVAGVISAIVKLEYAEVVENLIQAVAIRLVDEVVHATVLGSCREVADGVVSIGPISPGASCRSDLRTVVVSEALLPSRVERVHNRDDVAGSVVTIVARHEAGIIQAFEPAGQIISACCADAIAIDPRGNWTEWDMSHLVDYHLRYAGAGSRGRDARDPLGLIPRVEDGAARWVGDRLDLSDVGVGVARDIVASAGRKLFLRACKSNCVTAHLLIFREENSDERRVRSRETASLSS